ncbi:MAG: PD40 domain-containing protein [Xanthomonadales bacterium]|nr:Tricorn protease [Xanthomonadales bacterium]MCC6592749.1 PD40 domain-containing protein [Xanthomonadales bacterium]MCE7931250.1 protease [Xanthomonadales bacterium PRO6]
MIRPALSLALSLALAAPAHADTRLLRFPDVSDTHIAFVNAGDLYTVPRAGGVATRLTSHEGLELFPKFSPDGRWIAFSAQYSGTRQVWVMPADGSAPPRQLTWYSDIGPMPPRGGYDYRVLDWTPDGQHILVRMNRVATDERAGRPYLVPFEGGMETPLPVPETGGGMLSPDGNSYVYTPIDREFRTWKRSRGGRAQDVWIYDLANNDSRRLTDHRATDNQPTWVGERIYFTSDREYTLNLWSMDPQGGEPVKVTDFKDYDVLWPSAGRDAIVFEQAGALWLYTPADGALKQLDISVTGDRPDLLPTIKNVAGQIEGVDISPQGERVLVSARGELYTVPAKDGEIRNISRSPAARELGASFSPDGSQVAYLSDASGEYEIYLKASDGSGEPRRVTRDGDIWRFPPAWSPDGKRLAYGDKKNRLRVVEIASGNTSEVDQTDVGNEITNYVWSPDGQHLVWVKSDVAGLQRLWHWPVGGRAAQLTHGDFDSFAPAFDPQGRYLYFLSNRDHNLAFSSYEFNYLYTNATRIYAATLGADGPALGRPKSDEIGQKAPEPAKDGVPVVRVDREGFDARVTALGPAAGTYGGLEAGKDGVYYVAVANPQGGGGDLRYWSLADEKESTILRGIAGYVLARGGDKILFRVGQDRLGIADAKPDQDSSKTLNLTHLEARIDPRVEWAQILRDGWRIWRDWFYDPGMHGNDWEAIYQKYAALLPTVAHRNDLDMLINEMAGELNAGHIYVERGDEPQVARKPGGFLGANIVAANGGFRIEHIFPGQNWSEPFRSPLTEAGVGVKEGEYIVAVDGVPASSVKNFYELLENKAGRMLELRVASSAAGTDARTVRVKAQTSEDSLRYLDWVQQRRAMVDQLSGGRIGYIHLPNTAIEGNRELFKQFPAQIAKEALIVDDRYNGGGFIPDRMIEILARKPLNYWKRRGLAPQAQPFLSHRGPKAMLINGLSSSGGDALPFYFRELKLGPLIGTRTWGGLIGLSGNPGLVDGGSVLAATFRFTDKDGQWAVENAGVGPDVEVVDSPHLVAQGHDPSIEKAVEMLLAELKRNPLPAISTPPAPSDFGAPGKPLD